MSDDSSRTTSRPAGSLISTKIREDHLRRGAVLYVRQSTSQQLRDHQESTTRQYQLTGRLNALGWPAESVTVIDQDLGISGAGKVERPGFRRLIKMVTEQQVGIVMGLEMSRLARNSKDWHDLFEVCGIFQALIADEDGVFEPHDPNDRLVLGLKGIISELELHTMKVRLERGRFAKAERGELFHAVPVGYVLDEAGRPMLDPDASARHAIRTAFDLYDATGSCQGAYLLMAARGLRLPYRRRGGEIEWRSPGKSSLYTMLQHPLYAGAYGYGRKKNYKTGRGRASRRKHLPPEEWRVLHKDRFPAYISWERYEANQRRLHSSYTGGDRGAPPRSGSALLSGIVYCARCGCRLSPHYGPSQRRTDEQIAAGAVYICSRHSRTPGAASCQCSLGAGRLDSLISKKLLEALEPASAELSVRVVEDEAARREQFETSYLQRVERARYASELAERRYKKTDPDNRLVAASLEREWEASLSEWKAATAELESLRATRPTRLDDRERRRLLDSCGEVARLWSTQASIQERKQIVRLLIRRVDVRTLGGSERVNVVVHWTGGFESAYEITRTVSTFRQMSAYDDLCDRLTSLAATGLCSPAIAAAICEEGYRSPRRGERISAAMVVKLLAEPSIQARLDPPTLEPDFWRVADLARAVGVPEKRLKDWVTKGWATASLRPRGRRWVLYADADELQRLRLLASAQSGQGKPTPPETLRTPALLPRQKP